MAAGCAGGQGFAAGRRSRPGRRQRLRSTRFCAWRLPGAVLGLSPACLPAPSPGGCRLRSHGGSQWPDGFPDPSGVSMGCGLLWFSGQLSDESGPSHQIECGIFQYWDVGGRHMAPKHQFGARGQCLVWRAGTMSRPLWAATQWSRIRPTQEIAPNPLTHNLHVQGSNWGLRAERVRDSGFRGGDEGSARRL